MLLKKKLVFFVLFICLLTIVPPLVAQTPVTSIENLRVAFWPDYDEPAVLVLMTGLLPAGAELPAAITIPLPANAEVNAVARINSEVGMADTQFEIVGDQLTLITPDPQFRVEYYVPYNDDGEVRSYNFQWESDLNVGEMAAEIQQPAGAESLSSDPAAENSVTNPTDGLIYHGIPSRSVPAGSMYELSFQYNSGLALTAGQRTPVPQAPVVSQPENQARSDNSVNWLYLLGGLVLLIPIGIIIWIAATRHAESTGRGRRGRKSQKPLKPNPRSRNNNEGAKFCHECGTKAEKGDRFCRNCGTELKQV